MLPRIPLNSRIRFVYLISARRCTRWNVNVDLKSPIFWRKQATQVIWLKWYLEELRAHAILSNQKKQNKHSKLGDAVKWGECNILWHSCHDIVPYIVVSFLFSPELSWAINLQTIALKIYHEYLLLFSIIIEKLINE